MFLQNIERFCGSRANIALVVDKALAHNDDDAFFVVFPLRIGSAFPENSVVKSLEWLKMIEGNGHDLG